MRCTSTCYSKITIIRRTPHCLLLNNELFLALCFPNLGKKDSVINKILTCVNKLDSLNSCFCFDGHAIR